MHPAFSVIIFTTLSGAGYGLFGLLCLTILSGAGISSQNISIVTFISGVAATIGLISSLFHLGHPERAWRALSQWRSSWLSREGCLALLINIPMAVLFLSTWITVPSLIVTLAALVGFILSIITIYATSMIYRSIKAVPAWAHTMVPINYLLLACVSGLLALNALAQILNFDLALNPLAIASLLMTAALGKLYYWHFVDTFIPAETIESATGLKGKVKLFERPHSGENYLTKEMGYRSTRAKCIKMRVAAILLGFILPSVMVVFSNDLIASALAVLLCIAGLVCERWLFFAEARHTTMLYYGGNMQQ